MAASSFLLRALLADINQTADRLHCNMDLKQLSVAHNAVFDSNANQYEDDCLPGTRGDMLRQVEEWATSPQGKCIFWLNGRAGTGKSTIARTVAKAFSKSNLLGASFFFKRGEADRGHAAKLFPTIARQLARNIPQLIPGIQKAIHNDSEISTKGLKEQFDKLLLKPLLNLNVSILPILTAVIVIDALDECEVENDMTLIIQLLPLLQKSSTICLRLFITSRPDLPIRQGFSRIANYNYEVLVLHEVPDSEIKSDISLFLQHRLAEIKAERSMPVDWPTSTDFHNLVTLSVPLFIFAATACRLFQDPHWDPVDSLADILGYRNEGSKLEGMYVPILNRLLQKQSKKQEKQLVQEFREVVGTIMMLETPLSVNTLSRLIGLPERLVYLRLSPLQSVLSVPEDEALPVRLFHLSFRDFLLDPETSKKIPFWVNRKDIQHLLATRCLFLCYGLRRNICGLQNDGILRAEINLQTVNHYLSPELQYSCRYWAHHLVKSKHLGAVFDEAYAFLQRHFLHWMEAMSILGLISEVLGTINLLQSAVYVRYSEVHKILPMLIDIGGKVS